MIYNYYKYISIKYAYIKMEDAAANY